MSDFVTDNPYGEHARVEADLSPPSPTAPGVTSSLRELDLDRSQLEMPRQLIHDQRHVPLGGEIHRMLPRKLLSFFIVEL